MSRAAGEVVTLQLGNYANYVGTHWWNLQESAFTYDGPAGPRQIDNDVLYREGVTRSGEVTYTPRLIAYDLQCNIGSLRRHGSLYSDRATGDVPLAAAWPAELVKQYVSDAAPENDFLLDLRRDDALAATAVSRAAPADAVATYRERAYDLDETVQQWSDYLKVHLHPKTACAIDEYDVQAECETFSAHGYGDQIYCKDKYATEVEDKMHFFTEECDYLQGFQLLCDTSDGFGGFASRVAALLAEEFPRRPTIGCCVIPASFARVADADAGDAALHRLVNNALSWCALCDCGVCVVPLSLSDDPWPRTGCAATAAAAVRLPHVRYRPELPYHTSAVIAAALDTATLPYRIRDDGGSGAVALGSLHAALIEGGRRLCNVGVSLPFAMRPSDTFASALAHGHGGSGLGATSLLPKFRGSAELAPFVQSVVVRGVAGLNRQTLVANVQGHLTAAGCGPTQSSFACVEQPCAIEPPYPRFFDASVRPDGRVTEPRGGSGGDGGRHRGERGAAAAVRPTPGASWHLPALASLQCSTESGRLLRDVRSQLAATSFARLHRFAGAGLEHDDFTELLENLDRLASTYYYDDQME